MAIYLDKFYFFPPLILYQWKQIMAKVQVISRNYEKLGSGYCTAQSTFSTCLPALPCPALPCTTLSTCSTLSTCPALSCSTFSTCLPALHCPALPSLPVYLPCTVLLYLLYLSTCPALRASFSLGAVTGKTYYSTKYDPDLEIYEIFNYKDLAIP